jgi:hypothetical protein
MKKMQKGGSKPQAAPMPKGNPLTSKPKPKVYAAKPSAPKASSSKSSSAKSSSNKIASSTKPTGNFEKNMSAVGTSARSAGTKSSSSNTGKIVKGVIDRANKYPTKTASKPSTSSSKASAPAGKTVAQVWKEKTGMDWSEAKKRGLSDGSAKSNLILLAKLKSGAVSKESLSKASSTPATTTSAPAAKMTATGGSGIGATEREQEFKRGGMVKTKKK